MIYLLIYVIGYLLALRPLYWVAVTIDAAEEDQFALLFALYWPACVLLLVFAGIGICLKRIFRLTPTNPKGEGR